MAAIRRLLDAETNCGGGSTCPSCEMPFDKGKKRRLIDTCGHERCYTCMFTNEACPLCNATRDLQNELLPVNSGKPSGRKEDQFNSLQNYFSRLLINNTRKQKKNTHTTVDAVLF